MTGKEFIKWIEENNAEELEILGYNCDAGKTYNAHPQIMIVDGDDIYAEEGMPAVVV